MCDMAIRQALVCLKDKQVLSYGNVSLSAIIV